MKCIYCNATIERDSFAWYNGFAHTGDDSYTGYYCKDNETHWHVPAEKEVKS